MPSQRKREHDALRASMARFLAMLDAPAGVDQISLLRERMLFSQAFSTHLLNEHNDLHKLANAGQSALLRERDTKILKLREDYSTHIRQWTPPLITSDPSGYRSAVLALQRRLLDIMEWEERILPIFAIGFVN